MRRTNIVLPIRITIHDVWSVFCHVTGKHQDSNVAVNVHTVQHGLPRNMSWPREQGNRGGMTHQSDD